MSIFLSNTVTLIVLHILSTTRFENLDENIVEKVKKYKVWHDNSVFFEYCIVFEYHTIKQIEYSLNVENCPKKEKAVFNSRGKKQKLQWGQQKTEFQHKNDKTQFSTVS